MISIEPILRNVTEGGLSCKKSDLRRGRISDKRRLRYSIRADEIGAGISQSTLLYTWAEKRDCHLVNLLSNKHKSDVICILVL